MLPLNTFLCLLVCACVAFTHQTAFSATTSRQSASEQVPVFTLSGHSENALELSEQPTIEERRSLFKNALHGNNEWRQQQLKQKASPWMQSIWAERARKDARHTSSFTYRTRSPAEQNWHPAIAARKEAQRQQPGHPGATLNTRTTSFPRVRDSTHPAFKGIVGRFVFSACFVCFSIVCLICCVFLSFLLAGKHHDVGDEDWKEQQLEELRRTW